MGLYKIGDRVKVVHFKMLPEHMKNKAVAKLCGKVGVIEDERHSVGAQKSFYLIRFEGKRTASTVDFPEESLLHYSEAKEILDGYSITITFDQTGAIARLYESGDEFLLREVASGKGAYIFKGKRGAVQAVSYAVRMILQKVEQEEKKHGAVT